MNVNADTLTTLTRELVEVQDRIAPLREQEEALKAALRDHVATTGPGDYDAGGHTLKVTATRRLNTDKLAENYPASEHPELYRLTIDPKHVRRHLSPEVIDQFMGEAGAYGIRVS